MDMWFKDDIRNILASVNLSSAAASRWANSDFSSAYRLGYQEAIEVVAVAFGILPAAIRHLGECNSMMAERERLHSRGAEANT
jgi:hypothetical protein